MTQLWVLITLLITREVPSCRLNPKSLNHGLLHTHSGLGLINSA